MERKAAVAGAFYPADPKKLRQMIARFMALAETGDRVSDAVSYVAPHAGYAYSGGVAAYAYNALKHRKDLDEIDTFVIIGPNHTGNGYPISVSNVDWLTPLGRVSNDSDFVKAMVEYSEGITIDESAHLYEHSVEVQLPFLQSVVGKPRCAFVCMGDQSYSSATVIERAVSAAERRTGRRIAVIASSDFNHYESGEVARGKDAPAIGELERLDPKAFHEAIERSGDSACGYGPIAAAALYAKAHGARRGVLLKYANSGDVGGDYSSVVAYASLALA